MSSRARCPPWPFPPRCTIPSWRGWIAWPRSKPWRNWARRIGRTFAYELLQAVSPLDEATLQYGLRQLVEAELVYQHGCAAAGDLHVQACAHPGCRVSVFAAEHPPAVSSAYCAGISRALSRARRDAARAAGPSLYRGGPGRAGRSLLAPGGPARHSQRSANVEAISHLTKGLEFLKTLPDTSEPPNRNSPSRSPWAWRWQPSRALRLRKWNTLMYGPRTVPAGGETPQLFPVLAGCGGFISCEASCKRHVSWESSSWR